MADEGGGHDDFEINESDLEGFELDEEALGKLEDLDLDESIEDNVATDDIRRGAITNK